MLGLLLDNIIVYLFRTVRRLIGERRSRMWPVAEGRVLSGSLDLGPYPRADVIYTYALEGEEHIGTHTRGFYFKDSAKDYADRFAPSTDLNVRYNPQAPAVSIVRRQDQRLPP
jgi:hypothetical protein